MRELRGNVGEYVKRQGTEKGKGCCLGEAEDAVWDKVFVPITRQVTGVTPAVR
jgi:hypothetical protein